jgi:hypothetical protein
MKKLSALLMAGLMILSLAACGNGNADPSSDPSTSPVTSDAPSAFPSGSADEESAALKAAREATFPSGYLAEGGNGTKVLIAPTSEGGKALVISDSGESQAVLFGVANQTDAGKLTVTDDATGETFVCTFTQNEAGRVVIEMEDGTQLEVQTVETAAVTSALQNLGQ